MFEDVSKRAASLFGSPYYCAESVLLAVAEKKGVKSDLIPGIATGFCSGIARTGGMCGAVSGALMALGLFFGRNAPGGSVEAAYDAVRRFLRLFEDRFESRNCPELINCDLDTREGRAFFEDNNLMERCRLLTAEAARLAMVVIEEGTDPEVTG